MISREQLEKELSYIHTSDKPFTKEDYKEVCKRQSQLIQSLLGLLPHTDDGELILLGEDVVGKYEKEDDIVSPYLRLDVYWVDYDGQHHLDYLEGWKRKKD